MEDPTVTTTAQEAPAGNWNRDQLRQAALVKISKFEALANKGLIMIAGFLAISIAALRDFDFLPSVPLSVLAFLGPPPSANMISAALVFYCFSAIILILAKMMSGSNKYGGLAHLGYLSGFYLFYHFAAAMERNFWAVFAAGMTILALEEYHLWIYCAEEIRKERETLAELGGGNGKAPNFKR